MSQVQIYMMPKRAAMREAIGGQAGARYPYPVRKCHPSFVDGLPLSCRTRRAGWSGRIGEGEAENSGTAKFCRLIALIPG